MRSNLDKCPFSYYIVHYHEILVLEIGLCHLGWALKISLRAKAE